ncbi:MAG: DUF6702 family protein [Tenacibaculum sp.]
MQSTSKYYVALTEIEHSQKNKSIQMIMNVFMDDIELSLNKEYGINLQLASKNENKNTDNYFYKYLIEHFKIKVNQQAKFYNYISKEYYGNIVYFYLEIENITTIKSIATENTVLVKHFPEQQNLVKVIVQKKQKSLILNKANHKGLLKF